MTSGINVVNNTTNKLCKIIEENNECRSRPTDTNGRQLHSAYQCRIHTHQQHAHNVDVDNQGKVHGRKGVVIALSLNYMYHGLQVCRNGSVDPQGGV